MVEYLRNDRVMPANQDLYERQMLIHEIKFWKVSEIYHPNFAKLEALS